jgi:hypothetical protein
MVEVSRMNVIDERIFWREEDSRGKPSVPTTDYLYARRGCKGPRLRSERLGRMLAADTFIYSRPDGIFKTSSIPAFR